MKTKLLILSTILLLPAILLAKPFAEELWWQNAEKGYHLALMDANASSGGFVCASWGKDSERCKGSQEIVRCLQNGLEDIRNEKTAWEWLHEKGLR